MSYNLLYPGIENDKWVKEKLEVIEHHKLCPFCSGAPIISHKTIISDDRTTQSEVYYIQCRTCESQGPWAPTKDGAWGWWDLRNLRNA